MEKIENPFENIRNDDASATLVEKSNFIPCRLKATKV